MSDVALRAEGLSKRYRIGARPEAYSTARDAVADLLLAPFRRRRRAEAPEVWALRDASFEVARGEVVGVIGPNGAGKSTLLKILARITEPTAGHAEVRGRVGALLEVGTGFHQELTGRENVYLNGAILGMRRDEIRRKFDAIVDFAEVGPFLDTPVKHYSSGMHLRLAFAVAAHLEPEILLVDEVLAVGDAAFQRKCLGRMETVASEGRTVLFVSHNLGAVRELCRTTMVFRGGALDFRGDVVEGLAHYSRIVLAMQGGEEAGPHGTGWRYVLLKGADGGTARTFAPEEGFVVETALDVAERSPGGRLFCILCDAFGSVVAHQRVESRDLGFRCFPEGSYRIEVRFPPLHLAPGVYTVYFKYLEEGAAAERGRHVSERAMLDVEGRTEGLGRAVLAPPARWSVAERIRGGE